MTKNILRTTRLEMETLEDRLVPAFSGVQLAGGTLMVQGASTPNLVRVFEHGTKIEVEATDLSSGATLHQTFQKDKVHVLQLRQGGSGNDVFDNEVHDRHVSSHTFDSRGLELGDDNGAASHGAEASGHR